MKTNVAIRMMSLMSFAFALSIPFFTQAQSRIGVYGQAGRSDIEINGLGILDLIDPYIQPITQYSAGISYERELNQHLSFVTGAQYTSRGFGARESFDIRVLGLDLPVGASIETRLQYVEVPVQLKYEFAADGITPYIKAGASTAYAIDGKIQPKIDAIISWNLPAININLENDLYNRLDVSALVGAGVQIPTNDIGAVSVEVNYRHSLNDMFLDPFTDIRIKSHGWNVGVGYTMRF